MSFFISDNEAERILNHKNNLLASVRHTVIGSGNHNDHDNSGRKVGSTNYSTEIKALIGLLAKEDGVKRTSDKLGLAISQVSHYKNGKTQVSSGIKPDKELRKQLRLESEIAVEKLRTAIRLKVESIVDSIDDDKINKSDLSSASKAAANLSSVFKNFAREEDHSSGNSGQQFVFFGIAPKAEAEYEVLEAEVVSRS